MNNMMNTGSRLNTSASSRQGPELAGSRYPVTKYSPRVVEQRDEMSLKGTLCFAFKYLHIDMLYLPIYIYHLNCRQFNSLVPVTLLYVEIKYILYPISSSKRTSMFCDQSFLLIFYFGNLKNFSTSGIYKIRFSNLNSGG